MKFQLSMSSPSGWRALSQYFWHIYVFLHCCIVQNVTEPSRYVTANGRFVCLNTVQKWNNMTFYLLELYGQWSERCPWRTPAVRKNLAKMILTIYQCVIKYTILYFVIIKKIRKQLQVHHFDKSQLKNGIIINNDLTVMIPQRSDVSALSASYQVQRFVPNF